MAFCDNTNILSINKIIIRSFNNLYNIRAFLIAMLFAHKNKFTIFSRVVEALEYKNITLKK